MEHSSKTPHTRPTVILIALWSFVVTTVGMCFLIILLVASYGVAVYDLLQSIMDIAKYLK